MVKEYTEQKKQENPLNPQPYFEQGLVFYQQGLHQDDQGNEEEAEKLWLQGVESLTKAIELKKDESAYYKERARCYEALGEFEKQLEDEQTVKALSNRFKVEYLPNGKPRFLGGGGSSAAFYY